MCVWVGFDVFAGRCARAMCMKYFCVLPANQRVHLISFERLIHSVVVEAWRSRMQLYINVFIPDRDICIDRQTRVLGNVCRMCVSMGLLIIHFVVNLYTAE